MEYKIGDKVKIVANPYGYSDIKRNMGSTVTIIGLDEDNKEVKVKYPDGKTSGFIPMEGYFGKGLGKKGKTVPKQKYIIVKDSCNNIDSGILNKTKKDACENLKMKGVDHSLYELKKVAVVEAKIKLVKEKKKVKK